ncbi:MAG: hypothetical protein HY906_23460 [Deltaproteobacteria bacterium]|nr:hypothetical protein [Deltaproteobacteria bacterium]
MRCSLILCACVAGLSGRLALVIALVGLAPPLAGCGDAPPRYTTLAGDGFTVRYDRDEGSFDVTLADGRTVLERAFAQVEVRGAGSSGTIYRTTDGYSRSVATSTGADALGQAQRLVATRRGLQGAPDLTLRVAVYPGEAFFTVAVEAANPGAAEMVLNRLAPATVEAVRGGALRLGAHPATHRILEDGSFLVYDSFVDVVPGDRPQPLETVALSMVHGGQRGHSVSDWNHAIKDLTTGQAFVAGTLDFAHASPFFNTSFVTEEAVPVDGRTPFTYWAADFPYLPQGKPLAAGARLEAGPVLVIPTTDRPHEGLERWAAAVKQWNQFWLSVGMLGPHVGFADSLRLNLDTMPAWDKEKESQGRLDAQGFKPTVRTIARRYYLHGQVYLFNHDMIFFRSLPDPAVPPITRDESRCLVTAIGLSGGVAKLGERLVDMPADWINDYRVLLPVFGHAARPLDLFEREFPEAWHLHVNPAAGRNTGGDGPPYDVVALFNWGTNDDLTQRPYAALADEARAVSVDLGAIGLDPATDYVAREFWSGEVVDGIRGTLARTVAPHSVQVFALRPVDAHPQLLGGNRHLLQGAVEVRGVSWDEGARRLTVSYDAAPGTAKAPFEHQLVFRVPPGWSLGAATVGGATGLRTEVADGVLTVAFVVATRAVVPVVLDFVAP